MEQGFSTPVVVKIIKGNDRMVRTNDWEEEYKKGVVENTHRNQVAVNRAKYYMNTGTFPILVVCRLHEHVKNVFDLYKKTFWPEYVVDWCHGDRKDRQEVIEAFREGKVNILISSLITKRGQNLPLIRVIQNLAGGDDPSNPLQVLGRGTRTHESKDKFYYEDFWDQGDYLERHSKHRYIYYKNEGYKIIKLF